MGGFGLGLKGVFVIEFPCCVVCLEVRNSGCVGQMSLIPSYFGSLVSEVQFW